MNEVELDRVLDAMRDITCEESILGVHFQTHLRDHEAASKPPLELKTFKTRNKKFR
jgi:hypothetical protein